MSYRLACPDNRHRTYRQALSLAAPARPLSELEALIAALEARLIQAEQELTRSGNLAGFFGTIAKLLESLPLTTAEFSLAKNHLNNAILYNRQRECGAASFELSMIFGLLNRLKA
jgi:hypothetical protein